MNRTIQTTADETKNLSTESKRRSLVKSLIWRLVGIVWTWIGAYIILLLIPERFNTAAIVATLIVVYHHSTRMLMYYLYERIWSRIEWGKDGNTAPPSAKGKLVWGLVTLVSLVLIFFLILYVTPLIKT